MSHQCRQGQRYPCQEPRDAPYSYGCISAFADPENERIIQESFKKLAENKTTLLIAHRLSTVVNADKILVIEKGRIAEEGKHEALLEKNGIYKSLWDEYRRSVNWKIGGKND